MAARFFFFLNLAARGRCALICVRLRLDRTCVMNVYCILCRRYNTV